MRITIDNLYEVSQKIEYGIDRVFESASKTYVLSWE